MHFPKFTLYNYFVNHLGGKMKSLKQLKKEWPIKKIRHERKENNGRYCDDLIRGVREVLKGEVSQNEVSKKLGIPPQNIYRWALKKGENNSLRRKISRKK